MQNLQEMLPLTPHQYPWWIKISFYICCAILLIFLFDLPYHIKIYKKFKKADIALQKGLYNEACYAYEELRALFPYNKYIKLRLASSLFKSQNKNDHYTALGCLAEMTLAKDEWKELRRYMPAAYEVFFENKKLRT